MSKLYQLVLIAAGLSSLGTAIAHQDSDSDTDGERQFSHLYATIPGDPDFRIDPNPVSRTRAVLTREGDNLGVVVDSKQLPPGAYTVWMRVFNTPELCTGGEGVEGSVCSRGSDLATATDPSIPDESGISTSSVFWLTSTIVGEDGVAHVSTSVNTNEWPGMVLLGTDAADTERQAVWNPMGSEVHIVMRYHGPAAAIERPTFFWDPVTGELNDITAEEHDSLFLLGRQLNRMLGNCSPLFSEDSSNCSDAQLAVFGPPEQERRHRDR